MRCWFGAHQYRTKTIRPIVTYDNARDVEADLPVRRETELLQLCARCGKPRVRRINGRWDAHDLREMP